MTERKCWTREERGKDAALVMGKEEMGREESQIWEKWRDPVRDRDGQGGEAEMGWKESGRDSSIPVVGRSNSRSQKRAFLPAVSLQAQCGI